MARARLADAARSDCVEVLVRGGRRRGVARVQIREHRCPAVYCSTCEAFLVRPMTKEELADRDRGREPQWLE